MSRPYCQAMPCESLADPLVTTYMLLWGAIGEPLVKKFLGDDEYLWSFTQGFTELPSPAQVYHCRIILLWSVVAALLLVGGVAVWLLDDRQSGDYSRTVLHTLFSTQRSRPSRVVS